MKKNSLKRVWLLLIAVVVLTSCVSKRKMVYFGEVDGVIIEEALQSYEPKIQKGDVLKINVSAIDVEAAMPFNLYETPILGNVGANAKPLTYLVNAAGVIHFPVIGDLNVMDKTIRELTKELTDTLKDYINKPIVNIRLENFKVTVLGEVNRPGTYPVANERISILEAIGLAGDLSIQGNRVDIILIRERDGKREFIPIDLTNKKLFNSPYFYLAQNDVIYIEPNKAKINSSVVGANTSIIFASISSLISIIAILTN